MSLPFQYNCSTLVPLHLTIDLGLPHYYYDVFYAIKYSGPPNVPMVNYSPNNRTLYFHADSDSEYPVINYIISITDAVGIFTMLNSTSEFVVLNNSTYQQSCEPYNVTVTASNLLGASTPSNTTVIGGINFHLMYAYQAKNLIF